MTSSPADRRVSPRNGIVRVPGDGSPIRTLVALAALVGLAVLPAQTAPAPAATLPDFGVATLFSFYGTNVGAMAAGDLNEDGNADVVAVGPGTAGVRVGLGDGTGQLVSLGTFGTGAGPSSVALADFDGDGRLDAVTANSNNFTGTTFSVLFGTGAGAFAGEVSYPIGIASQTISKVAAGDVNDDGWPDIVTLSARGCGANTAGCSNVTVFMNDGAGGFSSGFTRPYNSGAGYYYSGYQDVQIADVNADNRADLVLVINTYDFSNEPQIQIMPGSGGGTFGSTQYFRYPLVNGNPPFHTSAVAVGDINNDGKLDIVAMAQRTRPGGNSHVIVMRNDGAGGFPQAAGTAHSLNWFYGTGVQIGDLNDDGHLDIAGSLTNSSGSLAYMLNDGGGNFPASMTNIWTANASSIVLADLNNSGEGTLDVALGGPGGVTLFVNGTATAVPCSAGTYSASGNEPCTPADPGYFVPTSGASAQTPCPSGYGSDGGAVACYPLDSDNDGVNDADDAYPNSDMHSSVRLGGCSAGVASQVMANGATFNDLLAAAAAGAGNHGHLVSAVTTLSNGWKSAGLISGRDHGAIVSCVARSK